MKVEHSLNLLTEHLTYPAILSESSLTVLDPKQGFNNLEKPLLLIEQSERLQLVLEGTRLGMWDWNPVTNDVIFDERWADMLGYSFSEMEQKLETGKVHLFPSVFEFKYFLHGILKLFSDRIQLKNLEESVTLDPETPKYVYADKNRLGQFLSNIISNAIKFTIQGFIDFSVKVLQRKGDRHLISIEIQDSGIGISEEFQKEIFQRFSQENSSKTRKTQGWQKPKMFALTADAFEETKVECIKAGIVDFLSKPYGVKDISEVLRKHSKI